MTHATPAGRGISPLAFVDPTAELGEGCTVGHFAVVEAGARLGPGCAVEHHAVIHGGTQLGAGCRVEAHAVLGRRPRPAAASTVAVAADLPPLTVGDRTSVGAGAVIYAGATIGADCFIGDLAFVREEAVIGDRAVIGSHVTVENAVRIGPRTKVQTGAYITAWTTVEEDCFIAPCVVTTNDNFMGRTERRFALRGGPVVRRGARVGANVTLLPRVEVGAEAFVAAAAVVTRSVPPATLVMGMPARPVRPVPDEEMVVKEGREGEEGEKGSQGDVETKGS
ncbi:MAG: acetyltransferase [Caldilineales bacterium]|nr:acetyltransferase [Caldilineales bacterium]MDW8318568.1 acyltransferase [Anaerolineae bacterium]